MTRLRAAVLLLRPSVRTTAWLPLLPAAAVGLAVVALDPDALLNLRLAAVALCAGAAFTLDDAAAETVAPSPTSLVVRRLVRIGLVLPLVVVLWALVLVSADGAPRVAVTLELGAMLAVTLAAASVATPFVPDGRGGLAAAPALLVLLAAAALAMPDGWTLFAAGPADARWHGSHGRWAGLLVIALLALLQASRDPGRARVRARASRRT